MNIKNLGIVKFHIKNLNKFDEITKFRLIVLGIINILYAFLFPITAQFYSLLELKLNDFIIHSATIIAVFSIFKTIGEKFVKVINTKISFSKIFLIMVILDIFLAIGIGLFFINPKYMIWVDMIIGTIQLPFFFAYSNSLNNYINYFYPESFTFFQNYKADINSESRFIGLLIAGIITLFSIKIAIAVFVIGMLLLSFWQLKHYNMFKKYDFKYMYNYHKNLRRKG